jgi:hypothetical protein
MLPKTEVMGYNLKLTFNIMKFTLMQVKTILYIY